MAKKKKKSWPAGLCYWVRLGCWLVSDAIISQKREAIIDSVARVIDIVRTIIGCTPRNRTVRRNGRAVAIKVSFTVTLTRHEIYAMNHTTRKENPTNSPEERVGTGPEQKPKRVKPVRLQYRSRGRHLLCIGDSGSVAVTIIRCLTDAWKLQLLM